MSESNESVNLFCLTAVPQADYQTNLAASSVSKKHRQIKKKDRQFANYTVQTSDDKGSSTGTSFPTEKRIESHDVTINLTEDLTSQLLPERAYAAMGLIDSEEVDVDKSWQHTIEILNPQDSAQLPAYGYAEKAGESASRPNAHNKAYPSMVSDGWTVNGEGKAILTSTLAMCGSGKQTSPSGITFFGGGSQVILLEDVVKKNYFRNSAGKLKLYPEKELGGTVFNVNCAFRNLQLSINPNLQKEAGYLGCGLFQTAGDSESGAIRGKCEIGDWMVQFNFTVIADDAYDPFPKLKTMQSISAQLDYEGATIPTTTTKHKASFILNAANIVSIEHTIVDGKNGWRITTEPLAIGQVMPFKLVVINDVESYSTVSW
ncbi:MAG TPA: hypothetical protein PKY82_02005 [Pyrinomonadaceae bacterium]|nr:hypothetical protein [Pyrinomonadaceae bacterium]